MAFDVSLLNDLIYERLDPIIQVVEEESLLRILDGYIETTEAPCPSVYRATYIVPDVPILECCAGYGDAGSAYQKDFEVACYFSGLAYCETDLAKLFRGAGRKVKYTAGQEDAGAAGEYIVRANVADFLIKFNRLLLLGDTGSSDTDLDRINGWITQAIAGGAAQPTITATSLWGALVQAMFALPENYTIYGDRIVMFVPHKYRKFYQLFLAFNKLWFGDNNDLDSVYGVDGVQIVWERALDATNQIFITPARNLVAIVSDRDDEYTYEWDYVKNWVEGDRYVWRIKGCIGVGLYDPTIAVVATIPADIASSINIAIDVNIIAPLGANGGVAVDDSGVAATAGGASIGSASLNVAATVQTAEAEVAATVQTAEAEVAEKKTRGRKPSVLKEDVTK